MRQYLVGNISRKELQQYKDGIDGTSAKKSKAITDPAQKIVTAAHNRGMSVDEYLRENWEQYDTDDGWNDAARHVSDIEKNQFSISENIVDINGKRYDSVIYTDDVFP